MARKTIVYEATVTDGHGTKIFLCIGQTKEHIRKEIENESNHVRVDSITSLGQKEVFVRPDYEQDDYAAFIIPISESKTLEVIPSNEPDYKFLRNKFQPQVDSLEKSIADSKNE